MELLLNEINSFFLDMDITFTIEVQIDRIHNETNFWLKSNKCSLYLSIKPEEYIYINNIEKCLPYSGTEILHKVI